VHNFFDRSPDGSIDNIIRQFSRVPEAKEWEPHFPFADIQESYKIPGAMGTFLARTFHTLVVTSIFTARTENILFDWKQYTGECYGLTILISPALSCSLAAVRTSPASLLAPFRMRKTSPPSTSTTSFTAVPVLLHSLYRTNISYGLKGIRTPLILLKSSQKEQECYRNCASVSASFS